MNAREYQRLAMKTANRTVLDTDQKRFENASLGLMEEPGEVAGVVKKYMFHGHKFDNKKLVMEIGDVLWYCALLCDTFGSNFDEAVKLGAPAVAVRDFNRKEEKFTLLSEVKDINQAALRVVDGLEDAPEKLKVLRAVGFLLVLCGELLENIESSFEQAMILNIEKLRARYPEGFTSEVSINRVVEKEIK